MGSGRPAWLVVECPPGWYWSRLQFTLSLTFILRPILHRGIWYWCDSCQNYYPNVGLCPLGWEAIEPQ
jgi:hypothetical protein